MRLGLIAALMATTACQPVTDTNQLKQVTIGTEDAALWVDPSTGCRYIKFHGLEIMRRRDGSPQCPDSPPAARQANAQEGPRT